VRNTIFDPKRLLGRSFHDPSLHEDLKRWPFTIVHESGRPKVEVDFYNGRRSFSAEEISAILLVRVKSLAEKSLGVPIEDTVLSVPANFCDAQRQAVLDAASIAGLNVLQLINEPTAAALALQKDLKGPRTLMIFDFGAGSLDASVVHIDKERVEVRATAGTVHLGGQDFDARLTAHLVSEFRSRHEKDLRANATALQRLRAACKEAKQTLSQENTALVELDALMEGVDFRVKVTKAKFEELCQDLFRAALSPVRKALEEARLSEQDVDNVLMVGGASKMPQLQSMLRKMFEGKELFVDEADLVARGAAIQAAISSGQRRPLDVQEVAPWSISLETPNGLDFEVVQKNSLVPCRKQLTLSVGGNGHLQSSSFRIYEEDRNGNKNLVGSVKVNKEDTKFPVSLDLALDVDKSGVIKVTSRNGIFHKVNTISTAELKIVRVNFNKLLTEERMQKLRLEEKDKLEKFVHQVKKDVAKFSQKLTQGDKNMAKDICDEVDYWLQTSSSSADGFEVRCRQRMFEMEAALEQLLAQIQMLSKKGRVTDRRNFGNWHHRPCALQAEQEQPFDYSMRSLQAVSSTSEDT